MKERGYKKRWHLCNEVRERLDGENGAEFEKKLDLFLKGELVPAQATRSKTASARKKFIVRDHFKKNSSEVKFSGFGSSFEKRFMGKIEELTAVELPMHHHDLQRRSLDDEILADLGGEEAAEVTLAGVFKLLKLQSHGESGALFTRGHHANIFYVRDIVGELRAVTVHWLDDGWHFDELRVEVDGEHGWCAGHHVFSCNF